MLARSFVMHEDFTAGGGLLQGVQADDEHVTVVQLFGCSQRGAALGGGGVQGAFRFLHVYSSWTGWKFRGFFRALTCSASKNH